MSDKGLSFKWDIPSTSSADLSEYSTVNQGTGARILNLAPGASMAPWLVAAILAAYLLFRGKK